MSMRDIDLVIQESRDMVKKHKLADPITVAQEVADYRNKLTESLGVTSLSLDVCNGLVLGAASCIALAQGVIEEVPNAFGPGEYMDPRVHTALHATFHLVIAYLGELRDAALVDTAAVDWKSLELSA